MKKWIISTMNILFVFGTVAIYALPADSAAKQARFKDVLDNHWAISQINQGAQSNYVSGYPDGTFQPNKEVTRAEFIKMIVDALKLPHSQGAIPWYQPYVSAAFEMELLDKSDSKEYSKPISRIEIMRIVSRGLAKEEKFKAYFDAFDGLYNGDLPFTDYREFQQKDLPFIALAYGADIISGYPDATMGLKKSATRAEAVVMIENLLSVRPKDPSKKLRLQELEEVSETGMNVTSVSNLIPLVDLSKDKIVVEHKNFSAKLKRLYVVPTEGTTVSLYERKFLWDRKELIPEYFQNRRGFLIAIIEVTPKINGDHRAWGGNVYLTPGAAFFYQTPRIKFGFQMEYPGALLPIKKGEKIEAALYGGYDNESPFNSDPILQGNNLISGEFTNLLKNPDRKGE